MLRAFKHGKTKNYTTLPFFYPKVENYSNMQGDPSRIDMDEVSAHYEGNWFQQFHMGILLSFTPPKKKITKKDSEGNCVQYW